MKRLYNKNLLIILLNILLILIIIKVCKITGFCLTIIDLISPLFFGYIISWIIRPVSDFLKKYKINPIISSTILYLLIIGIIIILFINLVPRIIKDIKDLLPSLEKFINSNQYLSKVKNMLVKSNIGSRVANNLNGSVKNIFNTLATILYSFIISFFLSVHQIKINSKIFKNIPNKLLNKINKNLRIYIRGTFLDMLVLFILASIAFCIIKLPSAIVFAFLIAITNVIPYIGPYIGGIPAVLVGLSISSKVGLIVLGIVVGLQIIEGSFVQPFIMSKSLKLNPILIIMGLIIFSHFFGVVGMLISTPVVSIVKISYDYYKKNKPEWFIKALDKL